jgi:hypothetical protein
VRLVEGGREQGGDVIQFDLLAAEFYAAGRSEIDSSNSGLTFQSRRREFDSVRHSDFPNPHRIAHDRAPRLIRGIRRIQVAQDLHAADALAQNLRRRVGEFLRVSENLTAGIFRALGNGGICGVRIWGAPQRS